MGTGSAAQDVVIVGAARTPIGSFGGALSTVPAWELGAVAVKAALQRARVAPDQVDEVFMGCIFQAGQGMGPARQASMKAGLPPEVPATTVNMLCGSGLKAVRLAAQAVRAGEARIVVAGGMESMSLAPYLLPRARTGYRMGHGELVDSMILDGLQDVFHNYHMGITAENVAERWGIGRAEQDEFAAWSQQKAEVAVKGGRFKDEIVPVTYLGPKGQVNVVDTDEYPRSGTTVAVLGKLRPAFQKDGTVTAGNASGINDGAAALVVTTRAVAQELGLPVLATLESTGQAGVDPAIMGIGPVQATQRALGAAGLSVADLDLIESNEAFAAQSLAVGKELGWDRRKLNVNGGAIALGHPVGASGARILVTLLYEMSKRGSRTGLATLCIGGGMGIAAVVRR